MTDQSKFLNSIITFLFALIILCGFIFNDPIEYIEKVSAYLKQSNYDSDDYITFSSIEQDFNSGFHSKYNLIDLSGMFVKLFNMRGFYSDKRIYLDNDNYLISPSAYTSTDYEADEIIRFKAFLDSINVKFMYVNLPNKYTDDTIFNSTYGVESYSNENADKLIYRLKASDIYTVDIRDYIMDSGREAKELFYRTDHHWTTRAALWGAKIIIDNLSIISGYDIDTSIYDEQNFTFTEWKSCWLGEQGRYTSKMYSGLDNYTMIKPAFDTAYTFINEDGTTKEGTFDDFISEWTYNTKNSVYENRSWHYSYGLKHCINNSVSTGGKILIIGDSFNQVTEPFISLGVHETDWLLMRLKDESFDIKSYILDNNYDAVIICYSQSMIGGHDNPNSGNYNMFSFD